MPFFRTVGILGSYVISESLRNSLGTKFWSLKISIWVALGLTGIRENSLSSNVFKSTSQPNSLFDSLSTFSRICEMSTVPSSLSFSHSKLRNLTLLALYPSRINTNACLRYEGPRKALPDNRITASTPKLSLTFFMVLPSHFRSDSGNCMTSVPLWPNLDRHSSKTPLAFRT